MLYVNSSQGDTTDDYRLGEWRRAVSSGVCAPRAMAISRASLWRAWSCSWLWFSLLPALYHGRIIPFIMLSIVQLIIQMGLISFRRACLLAFPDCRSLISMVIFVKLHMQALVWPSCVFGSCLNVMSKNKFPPTTLDKCVLSIEATLTNVYKTQQNKIDLTKHTPTLFLRFTLTRNAEGID